MRLRTRLILLIGVASIVPLAILGIGATNESVDRLTQKSADSQARAADQIASEIDLWLQFQVTQIGQQVGAFELSKLNDKKLRGFQQLVMQQLSSVHIVSIVNDEGSELTPSVFVSDSRDGRLAGKDKVSDQRFASFKNALPVQRMAEEFQAWASNPSEGDRPVIVGKPYTPDGRAAPVLPIIALSSPERAMFLAVELGLDRIQARFGRAAEGGLDVALLDANGALAIQAGQGLVEPDHYKIFQPHSSCAEVRYQRDGVGRVLSACAPVRGTGWMVVVAEPMSAIARAGEEIRNRTGFISLFAAILSVLFGMLFSFGVSQRVSRIRDAALAVAEGDLGRTVELEGSKEVRDLSRAFNFMSRRLSANQDRLDQQKMEISEFNEELKRQLTEQKNELTEANRLLLQSSRLVAVGEMGAGMAHELNNPLAGILGLIQVLQAQGAESDHLVEIEKQAQRCRAIVERLQRFSSHRGGGQILDREDWGTIRLSDLLSEISELIGGPFEAAGLRVEAGCDPSAQFKGDRAAISDALVQLCTSIRGGFSGRGILEISGGRVDKAVEISIQLSGGSISSLSDDWMAAGMGFWLARQVIDFHGGRFREPQSYDDEPVRWTLHFPDQS